MVHAVRPIVLEGDVARIPLTQGYWAIIDAADAGEFSAHNWYVLNSKRGELYACRSTRSRDQPRTIHLHREIMKPPEGMLIDHVNGDTLDNRRSNLRLCTPLQNAHNRRVNVRNALAATGVSREGERYRASIWAGRKRIRLGVFDTIEEARAAHHGAAVALRGKFVRGAGA